MTFLAVQGISKCYKTVSALDGIDLDVPVGSRTAIVGPSGSGKTTLLRIIAGFEAPSVGRIVLGNEVLADGPATTPAHLRGIGFVAQDGALFPHLSVADNIAFGFERRMTRRDERVLELMDTVELAQTMRDRRPHELSGGQQQRVALARALARQPRLMLLDEPFSALDTGLRENMRKAVARVLRAANITTILVTHDQAEALSFADQVAVLREGKLAQAGSPRELYLSPTDRATAAFLGEAIILPANLDDGWAECALGRIAADTGGRAGAATIMLRPEQLRLERGGRPPTTGEDRHTRHGRVTEIEFSGAVCTVAVSLIEHDARTSPARPGTSDANSVLIKCSSVDLPPMGADVRIVLLGRAHVFDATVTS
jgi:iron(III) transport system ATP-binding protein